MKIKRSNYLIIFGLFDAYCITHYKQHSVDMLHDIAKATLRSQALSQNMIGVSPMSGPVGPLYVLKALYDL